MFPFSPGPSLTAKALTGLQDQSPPAAGFGVSATARDGASVRPPVNQAAANPDFYPRRFIAGRLPGHGFKPGDYLWLLTRAISQPPILVFIPPAEKRHLTAVAVPIAPIWFGDAETLSDGSDPDGLPAIVSPNDLFANYDAAIAEQGNRCRVAIYDLLQSDSAGGEANV